MKPAELRGMSDEQLGLTLKDTEKHLFQLRFQSATDRLETPSELRKARREVARLRTIQRERELAKIKDLPADQLATRLAGLEAKAAAPGKRTFHRQAKRWNLVRVVTRAPSRTLSQLEGAVAGSEPVATGTGAEEKK